MARLFDPNELSDSIAGTESFESPKAAKAYREWASQISDVSMFDDETPHMGPVVMQQRQRPRPLIRTDGGNNFRIYLNSELALDPFYINSLCRFLDSRRGGDVVTFILGAKIDDYMTHMVGPIISAMQTSAATVKAIAAGYCSIPETMIWAFAKEREVYRYGALSIGITDITKVCPKYSSYFQVFFDRLQEIGILTKEEVDEMWKSRRGKFVMYQDLTKSTPNT